MWKSEFFPYSFDQIMEDINSGHEECEEWELLDTEQRVSLKARRMKIEHDGKEYLCCHFTDVTEYSMLTKEALAYTKNLAEISAFQSQIVQLMSDRYDSFMPALADYCSAKELMMYCETFEESLVSTMFALQTIGSSVLLHGMWSTSMNHWITAFFSVKSKYWVTSIFLIMIC